MVGTSGLEPPTSRLSGARSNHLSYAPSWFIRGSPLSSFAFLEALASGGDDGNRTHDPLLAGQVLSQLSYTPMVVGFSVFIYRTLKIEQQADLCYTLLTQYASSRRLLLFLPICKYEIFVINISHSP